MSEVLRELGETQLRACFDSGTWARGHGVHGEGLVRSLGTEDTSEASMVLEGEVWGTAPDPYDVSVRLALPRPGAKPQLYGTCTCPVGFLCKHVVAALLAARATRPARDAGWRGRLEGLLDEAEGGGRPPERQPLALLLEIADNRRGGMPPGPSLGLRPARPKKSGGWTSHQVSWEGLARGGYEPGHVSALRSLHRLGRAHSWYGAGAAPVSGEDVGPSLWSQLMQVKDAGVVLVGPDGATVELLHDRVPASLDLTRDGDAIAVRMAVGDADPADPTTLLLGDPAHTLVTRDGDRLRVGRLARPLDGRLRSMARRGDVLRVPGEDERELLVGFLPRLGRHVPATSSDGSVEIPEPPEPQLLLRVDWPSPATAELRWRWRYGDPDHDGTEVLTPTEASPIRRRDEELAVLERLVGALTSPSQQLLLTPSKAIPSSRRVGPEQLLSLPPTLIELRATGLVEVEMLSPEPEFREAEGEPEVRFAAGGTVPETGSEDDDARHDWLDLAVTVTVDGHPLPVATLIEAMTSGQDKVFLPGGLYVSLAGPELTGLADLVAEAAAIEAREPGTLRVAAADLGRWEQLDAIGLVDAQAAEWVRAARQLAGVDELPAAEPVGLVSQLRPYQLAGFRWLATLWRCSLGGVLADDMGLGKTLQALALIALARSEGAGPFLVVAPTSVATAWLEQAATHTPGLDVRTVNGLEKRRGRTLAELAEGADVVVTSYSLLRMESAAYADLAWGGLVVDEAQTAKNHRSATYEALRRVPADFRLAMTGTPFENRLLELWAVLSLAAPGLWARPQDFVEQVERPVERRHDELALARFRRRVRPFLLRRTKELVATDLPAKQEQVLRVQLGAGHRRVYDTHLQRERQRVLGLVEEGFEQNRIAIFGALTRLRQLSLHAGLVDDDSAGVPSAKIDLLVEHLTEVLGEGHRALVFSTFTGFLGLVRERLAAAGIETAYLDGRTRDRAVAIEEFRSGEASVFLISLKAGGVGLTLTEADYVYVLDPWWNPAAEAQAIDRAHRIGQQRPVFVYRLLTEDTIEEKVHELQQRKAALFAQVMDGDGAGSAVLDADDVRALFG
ncbi:DEAD/DEAH box helicase [Marmoricola endophyticus]|uniref:DEAD/DEAH box helicase n=1 Tax=Marmoricola endophyticus TaxID=2040280 RepID=UPI0016665BBB|nr:DEAD/DEAH box helicase [Marmoricola endophyticus]